MGLFDAFQSQRDEFDTTHHGNITHDVLGGAIAYEAAKAYEDHCAKNGKPYSHAEAKEIFAAFTVAAVTHLAETKGRDAWDAHKEAQAQKLAQEQFADIIGPEYNGDD
ncbi:CipC1 protein [Imleria badia]|nr:CipC1 protein [Imleria badia]